MPGSVVIGLDFGSESARGVRLDDQSGRLEASETYAYRHGIMTQALADGTVLPPSWALQDADDYLEAAHHLLERLGRERRVSGIGVAFTASTVLPCRADGTPLSRRHRAAPHAYVKLWKHAASQPWADRITAAGGAFLDDHGGRLSANGLIARAAEMAEMAPTLWAEAERFIEAADWLVWQLTGWAGRSLAFARYKAHHRPDGGYPSHLVPGLAAKLGAPQPIGTAAGTLTPAWRERTGVQGDAIVAVPVIDSHAAVPAVGAVEAGTLVGALGTSAVFMLLDDRARPLPAGIEGVARDGVLPGFWCFEAGQAGFGDTLAWVVRQAPRAVTLGDSFASYNAAAAAYRPGATGLLALDWWTGCRVPHGDALLSGLLVGLTLQTSPLDIYRALLESLSLGARSIVDHLQAGAAPVGRVVMTSGLSLANPLLMQIMADVLGRPVHVPEIEHLTAVGAAIHGAVAADVVPDYRAGSQRFGATTARLYRPDPSTAAAYERLAAIYRALGADPALRSHMHALAEFRTRHHPA